MRHTNLLRSLKKSVGIFVGSLFVSLIQFKEGNAQIKKEDVLIEPFKIDQYSQHKFRFM